MATTIASLSSSEEWASRAFWQALAPALHIQDPTFLGSASLFAIDEGNGAAIRDLVRREGYCQLPPVVWALPFDQMTALIARLDAAGIPVAFAFVFDEFWTLFLKLHSIIEALLGPGYLRLPDFWVWFVDPRRGDSGWRPHRDKTSATLRADGSPTSLTVWLPLTDATPLNGCMYMVPADRDPTYNTPEQGTWKFAHQDIRALPAQAGAILMWNQAVVHWGSSGSPRETQPRISVALEFQAGDVAPYNTPLMPPFTIPGFESRLQLIAKQILQYQHMYPLADDVKAAAQRLLTLGDAA